MKLYPTVRGEFETVKQLVAGKSLARLGDGEFAHVLPQTRKRKPGEPPAGAGRQVLDAMLTGEMWEVLTDPHPNLIVGIPTMDPKGPKCSVKRNGVEQGWVKHRERYARPLSREVRYYSAFVTRPDSAPWIDTKEFAEEFQKVWAGKRVAVVGKPTTKILPLANLAAKEVEHILCPERDAYGIIHELEDAIYRYRPAVALLSAGPCATVLAHRLCKKGTQAIDMGSAGAFLCRLLDA